MQTHTHEVTPARRRQQVPLFPSAQLHIAAAARVAAGLQRVVDFEPSADHPPSPRPTPSPPLQLPLNLDAAAVRRLLPVEVALEATALALRSLSDGSGTMPVRSVMRLTLTLTPTKP